MDTTKLSGTQIITDDAACARILADVGLLDKLRPTPPFTHTSTTFCYQGYYCLATYDYGHPNEIDNGFSIVMVPKTQDNMCDAARFFQELLCGITFGPRLTETFTVTPLACQ